jgi:protein disulfide-isomerase
MKARVLYSLLALGFLVGPLSADEVPWQRDIDMAARLAEQTDRLVLIHLWATWCKPCVQVERNVFSQPAVARLIDANYVAVKVNVDDQPDLASRLGVKSIPCDVIMTPQGEVVSQSVSAGTPAAYAEQIAKVARSYISQRKAELASTDPVVPRDPVVAQRELNAWSPAADSSSSGGPSGAAGVATETPAAFGPAEHVPVNQPLAASDEPGASQRTSYSSEGPSSAGPGRPAPVHPAGGPFPAPVGLEGFCPVSLVHQNRWVAGDARYGVIHRGRLYLFAGPRERDVFWKDPDQFAPALGGMDAVLALEMRQEAQGSREYGFFYGGRPYLFSSEQTMNRFLQSPERYAAEVLQAMR